MKSPLIFIPLFVIVAISATIVQNPSINNSANGRYQGWYYPSK